MIFLILILIVVLALGVWVYKKGVTNENYFKDRRIPYLKPTFLLGNLTEIFFKHKSFIDFCRQMTQFDNESRCEN